MPNKFITNLDLARQAEIFSGETAVFQGGIQLGIPFSGFPSGVDTSTITSIGVVDTQFAAFSGGTGTTVFNVTDPSSIYYNATATTLSISPYTVIDNDSITETVSATTYPTIMTFTALSGTSDAPLSISFTPSVIQEIYNRGLYGTLFDGLGLSSLGQTFIDESFYNDGSIFSGANLNMVIVEYAPHGTTPAWVTGTTSGTVIEYSALTQYWTDTTIINGVSGLTLPITPESAETKTIDYVWTLTDSTIIDENVIGLEYTGYSVTYSFNDVIVDPESPSAVGATGATSADTYYLGTVTASLENFSAGTLDYKGSTNWISIDGNATVTERLTVDRMTINNIGTGSPVTMLAVDLNGNVVGGTGGTTDNVGAFTSTTANNTIIPTNAAGNTNESNLASILAGVGNTISGSPLSYGAAITAGMSNEINGLSAASMIGGGQDNIISTSRSSIIGSRDGTINNAIFSFIGGGDTNTIDNSNYSTIVGGDDNTITCAGNTQGNSIIGSKSASISGSTSDDYNFVAGSESVTIFEGSGNAIIASTGSDMEFFGAQGEYNAIIGGANNYMGRSWTGGTYNVDISAIIGGNANAINDSSEASFIGGGVSSDIYNGDYSGIVGGVTHKISASTDSFIGGGFDIDINNSSHSVAVGGGDHFINDSNWSGLIAGENNTIESTSIYSIIGGGRDNTLTGALYSAIVGGRDNTLSTDYGGMFGGSGNTMGGSSDTSVMVGGHGNSLTACDYSVISGGYNNTATGFSDYIFMGGGLNNAILGGNFGIYSTIIGGTRNTMQGETQSSAIIGGRDNYIKDQLFNSAIIGGRDNRISGFSDDSVILGGEDNLIDGDTNWSGILGGKGNTVNGAGDYSSIIGGENNIMQGNRSVILGGQNITASANNTVYVPNIDVISGLTMVNILSFDDDGDAATGGLSTGEVYQTTGAGAAPLNAAGILMVKQ